MTFFPRLATAVLGTAMLIGLSAVPAYSVAGDTGHDVSSPQCATQAPGSALNAPQTPSQFGVVGVTNGMPYAANPCLAAGVQWALSTGAVSLYVNTANPGPSKSTHWPAAGRTSPARCVNATTDHDFGCAYDYGWDAARDALAVAQRDAGAYVDPLTVTWWLDVEGSATAGQAGNSWTADLAANTADLQGYVDSLRSAGVREVGIYSTAHQWTDITGGYTRATANVARGKWALSVRYPVEDGPVWYAGTGDVAAATTRCATASFTGGERLLSQYIDGLYDGDVRCADPDGVAPTVALLTPAPTTNRSLIGAAWRGRDTGSGLATYDVRYAYAPAHRSYGRWVLPSPWQRTAVRAVTVSGLTIGAGYCFEVRARDAAGNVSPWSPMRCVRRTS
jgi:hypothetical protein